MSRATQLEDLKLRRNKLVIVGQEPKANHPDDPLSPNNPMWSGARLARLADLDHAEYRRVFCRINLRYESSESKFCTNARTRASATLIANRLYPGDTLIVLGSSVQRSFDHIFTFLGPLDISIDPLKEIQVVMLPHPSGLNRFWNDPMNTLAASVLMVKLYLNYRDSAPSEG